MSPIFLQRIFLDTSTCLISFLIGSYISFDAIATWPNFFDAIVTWTNFKIVIFIFIIFCLWCGILYIMRNPSLTFFSIFLFSSPGIHYLHHLDGRYVSSSCSSLTWVLWAFWSFLSVICKKFLKFLLINQNNIMKLSQTLWNVCYLF